MTPDDSDSENRGSIPLSPFRSLDPPLLTPDEVWCQKCGNTAPPRVRHCAAGDSCSLGVSGEHLYLTCPACWHVELTETYQASRWVTHRWARRSRRRRRRGSGKSEAG